MPEYFNTLRLSAAAVCVCVWIGASSLAGVARAADVAVSGAAESTELDEVVVTARRREENAARVPAVVTAFTQNQLEERGVLDQTDLQMAVPGLTVRQTESNNNLNYVIRGQTVDAFSGSATAVVPYVNEVAFAPGGLSSYFDLQSLQVLKGPQGTLFGRNATGGAVLLTTAKPTNELAASLDVSGGNFGYSETKGMLNVPLIPEKLLLRAAFDILRRDGFQYNFYNGEEPGAEVRNVGRISVTARPTDWLQNDTVVQFESAGGTNASSVIYSYNKCGQLGPSGAALNCAADLLFGPQLDQNIGFPGAWAAYLAAHPKANPGGIAAALQAQRTQYSFWQVDEVSPTAHSGQDWFITNTTNADLNPNLQFKNIVGASRSHTDDLAAEIGSPYVILTTYSEAIGAPSLQGNANDQVTDTISEEPQLQGKYFGESLTNIVGAYFQQTRNWTFYPASYTEVLPVIPATTSISHWKQRDTTEAVYTNGSYDLGTVGIKDLTFSAGVRYSWEKINSDQLAGSRFYPGPTEEVSFHKPSWNVGLEYQVTHDLMTYIESRGSWRSGGINGIAAPVLGYADAGGSLFHPETTKDVEIGAKWSGDLAGRPAHAFVAAYNQWVDNVQRSQYILDGATPLQVTVNVPSARIRGFELDTGLRPLDLLQVGVTAAYTDATYTQSAFTAFGQSYLFGPYADSPRWTGTVYGQLTLPVPDTIGKVAVRADVYAQTGQYISNTAATVTPGTYLPGYSTTNMRLDWSNVLSQKDLTLSLFARNLFDKGYYVGGFALGNLLGINSASVGEPRMWGAELKYAF